MLLWGILKQGFIVKPDMNTLRYSNHCGFCASGSLGLILGLRGVNGSCVERVAGSPERELMSSQCNEIAPRCPSSTSEGYSQGCVISDAVSKHR